MKNGKINIFPLLSPFKKISKIFLTKVVSWTVLTDFFKKYVLFRFLKKWLYTKFKTKLIENHWVFTSFNSHNCTKQILCLYRWGNGGSEKSNSFLRSQMVRAKPGFMGRSLDSKTQTLPTETRDVLAARVYCYVSSRPPIVAATSFFADIEIQQGHIASTEGDSDFCQGRMGSFEV